MKEGRSWSAECFWGLFDEQEVFTTDYPEESERLHEILSIDPNAIFVNAYLHNLGPIDDEMTRDTLARALRWQYDMQYFRLADASIKSTAEPGFDDPVEVDSSSATVSNAKPDIPQRLGHCFHTFQRSISFRSYANLFIASPKLVKIPTCDLHQRPPPNLWTSINPERSVSYETRQKAHAKAKRTASTGGFTPG